MKTAPGTIDGQGNVVVLPGGQSERRLSQFVRLYARRPRVPDGFQRPTGADIRRFRTRASASVDAESGSQLVSSGATATAIASTAFWPPSPISTACSPASSWPAATTPATLTAFDWRNGQLTAALGVRFRRRPRRAAGLRRPRQSQPQRRRRRRRRQGRDHFRRVVLNDNGIGLYSTGLGHGDAMHVVRHGPDPPRPEVFSVHESPSAIGHGAEPPRCAARGDILWHCARQRRRRPRRRGRHRSESPGYEFWVHQLPQRHRSLVYSATGQAALPTPSNMHDNFVVWWDADLLREPLDGTTISDWNSTRPAELRPQPRHSPAANCPQCRVEQRHQEHARPVGRHPRRLARGGHLAPLRQHGPEDLHHDHRGRRTACTR